MPTLGEHSQAPLTRIAVYGAYFEALIMSFADKRPEQAEKALTVLQELINLAAEPYIADLASKPTKE